MKKIRRILTLSFCGMGLLFLLVSVGVEVWFSAASAGMTEVEGVIEELGVFRRGMPTVSYTVDGQTYRLYSNVSLPHFKIGAPYTVLVNLSDPARAMDPNLRLISVVFAVVGFVMAAVGALCHIFLMHKARQLDILRACGLKAEGVVERVYQNHVVRLNRHSPWVVEAACLHPYTREKLTAKSSWLWETRLQPGDRVDIYVDTTTGKAMVDLEEDA